jgi:hypothetical protein
MDPNTKPQIIGNYHSDNHLFWTYLIFHENNGILWRVWKNQNLKLLEKIKCPPNTDWYLGHIWKEQVQWSSYFRMIIKRNLAEDPLAHGRSWKLTANLSLYLPFYWGAMEDHGQCVLKVPSDHTTAGVCVQIDCVPCPDPQSFAARNWIDEISSKQFNLEKHCFNRHGMTTWKTRHNAKHKGKTQRKN